MKKILAILLIMCCALPVMAKKRQNEEIITPLTQLEKRQFQTKSYPAQDNIVAMKSVLNVLQDEGFIVYNVNSLLGYIYGVKDFDTSDPNVDISKEFGLTKSRLNYNGVKVATLEVSVNVTQFGEQTRIRTNFKRKLFNEYGNAQMIDDIDEAEYYSDFYKKVDDAIVLQKQIAQKTKKEEIPVSVKRPVKAKPPVKRPLPKPAPVVIQQQVQPETTEPQPENLPPALNTQEAELSGIEMVKPEENAPVQKTPETVENVKTEEITQTTETADSSQRNTKQQEAEAKQVTKEEVKPQTPEPQTQQPQKEVAPEYTTEQILDLVPVDNVEEPVMTSKEEAKALKELVKQAKLEAKQAQKEALQAQKEAIQLQKDLDKQALEAEKEALKAEKEAQKQTLKEEKEALKEAKRQAKEMKE